LVFVPNKLLSPILLCLFHSELAGLLFSPPALFPLLFFVDLAVAAISFAVEAPWLFLASLPPPSWRTRFFFQVVYRFFFFRYFVGIWAHPLGSSLCPPPDNSAFTFFTSPFFQTFHDPLLFCRFFRRVFFIFFPSLFVPFCDLPSPRRLPCFPLGQTGGLPPSTMVPLTRLLVSRVFHPQRPQSGFPLSFFLREIFLFKIFFSSPPISMFFLDSLLKSVLQGFFFPLWGKTFPWWFRERQPNPPPPISAPGVPLWPNYSYRSPPRDPYLL